MAYTTIQPAFTLKLREGVPRADHRILFLPATIPPGCKVKSVQETRAEFKIDFEDGSSATLCLADPGSSVAVRDKNHAVEYLG